MIVAGSMLQGRRRRLPQSRNDKSSRLTMRSGLTLEAEDRRLDGVAGKDCDNRFVDQSGRLGDPKHLGNVGIPGMKRRRRRR